MTGKDVGIDPEKARRNPLSVYMYAGNDHIGRLVQEGRLNSYQPMPGKVLVRVLTKEDTHDGVVFLPDSQRDTRVGQIWQIVKLSSVGIPEEWRERLQPGWMCTILPGSTDGLDWRVEEEQCRYFEMAYQDIHSVHDSAEYAEALAQDQEAFNANREEADREREEMREQSRIWTA